MISSIALMLMCIVSMELDRVTGTSCDDIKFVILYDESKAVNFDVIPYLKKITIPSLLQIPQYVANNPRRNVPLYQNGLKYQPYPHAQRIGVTLAGVGIGQQSSLLQNFSTNKNVTNVVPFAIYGASGYKELELAANLVLKEMSRRAFNGKHLAHSFCHPNASCSISNDIMKCACKPGFSGNGFDCQAGAKDQLEALIHEQMNSAFLGGSKAVFKSADRNVEVRISKFEATDMEIKVVRMNQKNAKEN